MLNEGDEVYTKPGNEMRHYTVGPRNISLSHDCFTRNGNRKAFIRHAAPGYYGNLCYTLDIDEEQWLWSPLFMKFQKREPKIEYDNSLLNKVYKSLGK